MVAGRRLVAASEGDGVVHRLERAVGDKGLHPQHSSPVCPGKEWGGPQARPTIMTGFHDPNRHAPGGVCASLFRYPATAAAAGGMTISEHAPNRRPLVTRIIARVIISQEGIDDLADVGEVRIAVG